METATSEELEANKPLHFRQEVIIKGLPYIFEGDIPQEPEDFEWSVSLPNWEEQKPGFEERMKKGEINPTFDQWLETYNLSQGRVGVLEIDKVEPPDNNLSIGIGIVRTQTTHLPKKFKYDKAEGIGNFLLDNLCALADIKKWRIYLEPLDRGGKLDQFHLYRWYRRKGFEDDFNFPKESHDNFGGMQRWSKEPDNSQIVATILSEHHNNSELS